MGTPIRISEAASIALHACIWLARDTGRYHATREICAALACSQSHLAKVMQDLARARIIQSQRGPSGGIRLAARPDQTTLRAVYEAVDGAIAQDVACLLPLSVCPGEGCVLGRALAAIHNQFASLLARTTLADIVNATTQEKL
ncbi:MAG: Rrf2 family transcriptional regulator [Lentisphaerae bacterium]|nr:Rrf2 family transcriptional regulator [Lentisphaerota bacterium]